jgi:hypothetical protein
MGGVKMRKLSMLMVFMLLSACSSSPPSDKDVIGEQLKIVKSFEGISPYIDGDISYEITINAANYNNYTNSININALANEEFSNLSNNEKIKAMNKMRESINESEELDDGEFTCGDDNCGIERFIIINDTDQYSFEIKNSQFVYLNNRILLEEKTGLELQQKELEQSIQSKLNYLAENLYMLNKSGNEYIYEIKSKHSDGYEATYSFSAVQETGRLLAAEIQKTNSPELIEVAKRLESNTSMIHDLVFDGELDGGAKPDEIKEVLENIVLDMKIIDNSYPTEYVGKLVESL